MDCDASTGGDSLDSETQLLARNRLVMSFRLQDSQARLSISMESTAFDREEAPSPRSFMGDKLTQVPTCPIVCDQLRIAPSNHCLIGDL